MKNIVFVIVSLVFAYSCNSKSELTKENLQGDWTCFEYTMEGSNVKPDMLQQTSAMTKASFHSFSGDTLIIQTTQFRLGFSCKFLFADKKIICNPIGFQDIKETTYTILDYTGDVLVLQETNPGIVSTTYLKRGKK